MPKVIRRHPVLLELINGVKFAAHEDGSISEDVSEEVAAQFLEVPGYELARGEATAPVTATATATAPAHKPAGGKKKTEPAAPAVEPEAAAAPAAAADAPDADKPAKAAAAEGDAVF